MGLSIGIAGCYSMKFAGGQNLDSCLGRNLSRASELERRAAEGSFQSRLRKI